MIQQSVITNHVTNASGTIAIASGSTSMGMAKVASSAPIGADNLIHTASDMISMANMISGFAALVLFGSFLYNIYSTRKNRDIANKNINLRQKEYELELKKLNAENEDK